MGVRMESAPDIAVRELMAVREIVHAFLTADRPEEVFQFALDRVSPLVGATFASVSGESASSPGPATTRTIGNPNRVANSKSRSSCPGTAMMAPVPYSIRT